MLVDEFLTYTPLAEAGRVARAAEEAGYDGVWTPEVGRDPFLPHVLTATETDRITVGTSIAVAFARNPMNLAQLGWDLNTLSAGRFVLGLGSQIKPHITKRYSMPWSDPAARMREMVLAMQAIWHTWATGEQLDFRGEYYTHTLMTPMFAPQQGAEFGAPKVFIAGVGPLMTRTAGEVANGFFAHAFTTPDFLRDVTVPRLAEGRTIAERTDPIEVTLPVLIATGDGDEALERAMQATRERIAFYGSTPAYRGVLEHHAWEDLQPQLHAMSKTGQWAEMGGLIEDDVLQRFAIVSSPDDVAAEIGKRYGDTVQRVNFYTPAPTDPEILTSILADLKAA